MAKYTVTHSCGHSETVQLVGPGRERESRREWLESSPCTDCWQAEKAAKRTEATAQATAAARQAGLPTLEGSEKQVAWAETIRQQRMTDIAALTVRADATPKQRAQLELAVTNARQQVAAHWWIETREHRLGFFLKLALDL